jgi:hypothetical protein
MCIGHQSILVCALTLTNFAFFTSAQANHPFHVSTAEVEFNAQTNRLEVGLKCQTTDLERALRLMAGKKIDIESDSQVDELITRYVSENFYLSLAPGNAKVSTGQPAAEVPDAPKEPIKLIGKEFETKWIWVFFELQPPAGDEPLVLVNRVLFEVNTGQINTCLIRHNGKRHALKATANKPLQDFDRIWLTSSATAAKP